MHFFNRGKSIYHKVDHPKFPGFLWYSAKGSKIHFKNSSQKMKLNLLAFDKEKTLPNRKNNFHPSSFMKACFPYFSLSVDFIAILLVLSIPYLVNVGIKHCDCH